jgi:hypothetical protein
VATVRGRPRLTATGDMSAWCASVLSLERKKEFTEPVALLSTQPDDLPLPRTASGLSFNLLALRARCVEEPMGAGRPGQVHR